MLLSHKQVKGLSCRGINIPRRERYIMKVYRRGEDRRGVDNREVEWIGEERRGEERRGEEWSG
jgi:hypothetical protein